MRVGMNAFLWSNATQKFICYDRSDQLKPLVSLCFVASLANGHVVLASWSNAIFGTSEQNRNSNKSMKTAYSRSFAKRTLASIASFNRLPRGLTPARYSSAPWDGDWAGHRAARITQAKRRRPLVLLSACDTVCPCWNRTVWLWPRRAVATSKRTRPCATENIQDCSFIGIRWMTLKTFKINWLRNSIFAFNLLSSPQLAIHRHHWQPWQDGERDQ